MDLWLCANFIHSVFLVFVDLTLPARRVRYTLMVHVDEEKKQANPVKIMTSGRFFGCSSASFEFIKKLSTNKLCTIKFHTIC